MRPSKPISFEALKELTRELNELPLARITYTIPAPPEQGEIEVVAATAALIIATAACALALT